jgi:hypothetical protein
VYGGKDAVVGGPRPSAPPLPSAPPSATAPAARQPPCCAARRRQRRRRPPAQVWWQYRNTFPYIGGIVPVIVSWLISPLLSCIISYVFFTAVRGLVLRRRNSTRISYWVRGPTWRTPRLGPLHATALPRPCQIALQPDARSVTYSCTPTPPQALPVFIFITIWANLYFILTKGAAAVVTIDYGMAAAITSAVAGGCALLSIVVGFPLISKKLKSMAEEWVAAGGGAAAARRHWPQLLLLPCCMLAGASAAIHHSTPCSSPAPACCTGVPSPTAASRSASQTWTPTSSRSASQRSCR